MKVSQEKTGELTSLIKIEIEQNDYQSNVEKQLKDQRKKMTMPGFRVGQVPLSVVKKMYETPVKAQEIERLMSDNMYKFIEDNKIKVLGSPMANDEKTPAINWEKDTNYTFYFDIAVQPEFDLDLKKQKAVFYEIEPTEDMIDRFVEDMRNRFGKVETPETIGEKDMVYGHLVELNEDGTTKEGGIDLNTTLYTDRIALVTIKKQFIGKKKDAEIKFKPAKALKDVAQLATFIRKPQEEAKEFASDCKFTVLSIQRMTPAELNEEFYNRVYAGKDIKDEKTFRQIAKEDLAKTYSRESDNYFLNKTSEELVKNTPITLPEEFLKRWLISTNKDENAAEKIEKDLDKYMDGVRWQLIEGKISETYNLSVSDDEIIKYYKEELLPSYFPAMPDETPEQAKEREQHMTNVAQNMLNEREQSRQVYNYLFDRKITATLKDNMKVDKKTVSMDEFIKVVSPSDDKTAKKATKKKTSAKAEKEETKEATLF